MDPITHGALGAVLTEAFLYPKDKKYLWRAGALSAMAPDLDIFIQSKADPLLIFLYHRHFTHSLIFIPFGAILVFLGLLLFKCFRKNWPYTLLACLIGYGSHGLLDACTSYGTMLYWPFTNTRVSWDLISIIDPFFTFPLIISLVWSFVHQNRLGVYYGVFLASSFLLFNSFQHYRAIHQAQMVSQAQGLKPTFLRAIPDLASSIHWRSILRDENFLYVKEITTVLTAQVEPLGHYPLVKEVDISPEIKKSASLWRDFEIFHWFSDGYTLLVKQDPLILADGRFLFGKNPLLALWGIEFLVGEPHVKRLGPLVLPSLRNP